eukprot:3489003-Amphidinium_carterae.1
MERGQAVAGGRADLMCNSHNTEQGKCKHEFEQERKQNSPPETVAFRGAENARQTRPYLKQPSRSRLKGWVN